MTGWTKVVEQHLQEIGRLKKPGPDEHQQKLIAEKRAEYLERQKEEAANGNAEASESSAFPPAPSWCNKCHTKAAIVMDGCLICLNCGERSAVEVKKTGEAGFFRLDRTAIST